jgi:Ca-activated chloride channel family protein
LEATDRSVTPYQKKRIRNVHITAGQTVEKTVTFGGAGILEITAVKDGKPFQASVTVYSQDDKKNVGSKGTWSNKKPAIYKLVPGVYRLRITDRSVKPYQTQEIRDINIVSGKTVKRVVGF